jgi:ADP-heptose:LPS heptosyltransferase
MNPKVTKAVPLPKLILNAVAPRMLNKLRWQRMSPSGSRTFFQRTSAAKKVMVLDLGFLGDTVHLLPALWVVRQAYPQAELHAAVSSQVTSFMECVPWVNRVWGYMRYPRHATLRENFQFVTEMRREKFDVLINLNGSDRSSWLTFFSGARERLGRLPRDGGGWFWKQRFTAHVWHPFGGEPVYLQRCHCLEQAGFPFSKPEFQVEIKPAHLAAAGISETDKGNYFHISPFTTADARELPPEQVVDLMGALAREFPGKKIALSCAPTPREREKLDQLLALLPQKPWRVFPGNLNLVQLAAVIKNSALHFSGDTGPFHLAVMTRSPAVAWFCPFPEAHMREWVPAGNKYRVLIGNNPPGTKFLGNIQTADLVRAATQAMAAR